MNLDAVINQLTHVTGASRREVIQALGKFNSVPEVRKYLDSKRSR